jgi:diguanylate cyclase (GGDEF)-like protein/PAS domain S-box-containing protein
MTYFERELTDNIDDLQDLVRSQNEHINLLSQASQRFQDLFQGLPIACFGFNQDASIVEWNRSCINLFNLGPGDVMLRPVWEVVGRNLDWEITKALVSSVLTGLVYDGYEWEDVTPEGATRYFLAHAYPLRNREGDIIGGICANIDITDRKEMELALHESEERWQLALKGSHDGIWDWNIRSAATYFSARCHQMLGYEEGEEAAATRDEWNSRIHPDDRDSVELSLKTHIAGMSEHYEVEYRILKKNGEYAWILDKAQALWNRNREALRIAGSFTDITMRKENERQLYIANRYLEELALQDGLTGLFNRRAFDKRLSMEVERANMYEGRFALIMIDVDNFKSFNDTFGHPAGDTVLKSVSEIIMKSIRDSDSVARYGGEEFVIILPQSTANDAAFVAERCRANIENHSWALRRITASFGVSVYDPQCPIKGEELVDKADQALYMSKSNGRNRVTLMSDIVPIPINTYLAA